MIDLNKMAKVLKYMYGEDFEVNENNTFWIYGTINGKRIELLDTQDGLWVNVPLGEEELLKEIVDLFTKVINSQPICRYNLADSEGNLLDISVEWNTANPDERMKKILNNTGFNPKFKAVNLNEYHLSSKRKLELAEGNQFSPILFKGYHLSDERLYQHFAKCSEADLALILKTLNNFWHMVYGKEWNDIWPDEVAIEEAMERACQQVQIRFLNFYHPATPEEQIRAWMKCWNDYFTLDRHLEYIEKRKNGEDVSTFRPENHWREIIKEGEYVRHLPSY